MCICIKGTGSSLPENFMSNDDLAKLVDTSDEWIRSRVGIETRYIVKEETTTSMAADAAKKALDNAGVSAKDIELIIVASLTSDKIVPSTACRIQNILGAENAMAFDVNSACSGFVVAFNTAMAYFKSGMYKRALLVGVETLSKIVDWSDRSTCVLFGDGAGAAVVEYDEEGEAYFVQGADGSRGKALDKDSMPINNPFVQNEKAGTGLYMDGQAVYKFAVKIIPECVNKLCESSGIVKSDIKYYVLHQANKRIIQTAAKRLGEPQEKFPVNVDKYGNTSAASIPILLDEMNREGKFEDGDRVVICGFGGGLSWAAALIRWRGEK